MDPVSKPSPLPFFLNLKLEFNIFGLPNGFCKHLAKQENCRNFEFRWRFAVVIQLSLTLCCDPLKLREAAKKKVFFIGPTTKAFTPYFTLVLCTLTMLFYYFLSHCSFTLLFYFALLRCSFTFLFHSFHFREVHGMTFCSYFYTKLTKMSSY